jgi:hypothetical protein
VEHHPVIAKWPLLLTASLLLMAGAAKALPGITEGDTLSAFAAGLLVGAALVMLGQWTAAELRRPSEQ